MPLRTLPLLPEDQICDYPSKWLVWARCKRCHRWWRYPRDGAPPTLVENIQDEEEGPDLTQEMSSCRICDFAIAQEHAKERQAWEDAGRP
jgi:hypothetical protein